MVWGLTLQFLLGLFVLRTNVGQQTFSFLGKQVEHFLSHVIAGVEFVFGDNYKDFEFVFKVVFFYHIINNFEFSYATHLQNNLQFYSNSMYPACKHYPINQSNKFSKFTSIITCLDWQLMPTVIFVNSAVSVLYHIGVMQAVIEKLAVVMYYTMGTSAAETLCTASSIFLGQVLIHSLWRTPATPFPSKHQISKDLYLLCFIFTIEFRI